MPNGKGYKNRDESFYQPAKLSDREREGQSDCSYHGDGHDFNIKGKVTAMGGSYADMSPGSGMDGNYSDKDSSLEYLRNRNKQGQMVQAFTATERHSRMTTGGGATAYDSMPIPEVYKPATSHGAVPPDAIEYKTEQKDRNVSTVPEEKTFGNSLA